MTKQQYENLLRFLAEEYAHFKYQDDAVEWNETKQEHVFRREVNSWINYEIENLRMTLEMYNCKPKKENIITKFIKLWKKKK